METITINPPIKIGDKVWLDKGFGCCNFLDRYKNYQECTIRAIQAKATIKEGSNKLEYEFVYQVEEEKDTTLWHVYNERTPRTKEQLYESFREEIEELIPEDLRKYLWKL